LDMPGRLQVVTGNATCDSPARTGDFALIRVQRRRLAYAEDEKMAKDISEKIVELEATYVSAELARDTATLNHLFAADLVYTTFRGVVADKAAALRSAADERVKLTRLEVSDMSVLPLEKVAVVTGRADIEMQFAGVNYSGGFQYTHIPLPQGRVEDCGRPRFPHT
jgi:hypothetical protein